MKNKIREEIGSLRWNLGKENLRYFALAFFAKYLTCPLAPFQLELLDYLQDITLKRRGSRYAFAAPRGYAKSSLITLIYVLWCICYKYESCILIISSTKDMAKKLLDHIKEVLNGDGELPVDFPNVCEPPNPRWRADEIVTKNKVNVIALGVGSRMRGIRFGAARPGLVIADDIESFEGVRTAEGRDKVWDWLTHVVFNLGHGQTNYIVCGTILHFDSTLAKLIAGEELAGWDFKIHKAIVNMPDRMDLWDEFVQIYRNREQYSGAAGPKAAEGFYLTHKADMLRGSSVLWEAKESLYDLFIMREQKGEAAFSSEKMNEPKAYEILDMKTVNPWDATGRSVDDLLKIQVPKSMIEGSCDPAVTVTVRSDYSAIITAVRDLTNGDLYVIGAESGRWDFDSLVKRIRILHQIRPYAKFIFESNAAQAWLGNEIQKQCPMLPLQPLVNLEPKEARITRLILLIKNDRVKLSKKLPELNRQLGQYPYCAHDDLVDALSMLVTPGNEDSTVDVEKRRQIIEKFRGPGSSRNPDEVISSGGNLIYNPLGMFRAK